MLCSKLHEVTDGDLNYWSIANELRIVSSDTKVILLKIYVLISPAFSIRMFKKVIL